MQMDQKTSLWLPYLRTSLCKLELGNRDIIINFMLLNIGDSFLIHNNAILYE